MDLNSRTLIERAEQLLLLVKSTEAGATASPKAIYDQKHQVAALCDEMKRAALGPSEYTAALAEMCQESSALHFVTALGVADIIGDGTASLDELVKKTGVDELYLSTTMRNVLGNGYFEEVGGFGSQVFRNNSYSQVLRSGQPESMVEAIGFICDEGAKSTTHLLEAAKGGDLRKTCPFNVAFSYKDSIFRWLAESEGNWRGERMGKAMQQLHRVVNGNTVHDFDWDRLASPLVDVGGGIGSLEMALTDAYPKSSLEFVVFDIPETAENAKKIWSQRSEAAQARVSFVGGNFLANTLEASNIPQGQPSYIIRHALHNWTDDVVVSILGRIREAMLASPSLPVEDLRLFVCDMVLTKESSSFVRSTSMQLLTLNNGKTRTSDEMFRLIKAAGFEIIIVHEMRAVDSIIEARPQP